MIRYLIVADGTIMNSFHDNQRDMLISAYVLYRRFHSNVSCFEIGYSTDTEKFYAKKMMIEKKGNNICIS